jgi:hypothetical protein
MSSPISFNAYRPLYFATSHMHACSTPLRNPFDGSKRTSGATSSMHQYSAGRLISRAGHGAHIAMQLVSVAAVVRLLGGFQLTAARFRATHSRLGVGFPATDMDKTVEPLPRPIDGLITTPFGTVANHLIVFADNSRRTGVAASAVQSAM